MLETEPLNRSKEIEAEVSSTLLSAADHVRKLLGNPNITHKELNLLSHYVRQVLREKENFRDSQVILYEEVVERWFRHITSYSIADFKFFKDIPVCFPAGNGKLIERLREKFNNNDDKGSFE